MQRYLSIDILRGVAILLMVQVHFIGHLSPYEESSAWIYLPSGWLGMTPAPLFTFLSGLSFCLWTRKQESKGQADETITKVAIRRGLFLFGSGIALNVLVWLPEETFNWDILTLIGASFVILAFARKLPTEILALICGIVVLLSPPFRVISDYAAYWDDYNYVYDFTLIDVVSGFFLNGYFPLLPWIVVPMTGFIVGDIAVRGERRSSAWQWRLAIAGIGFILFAALMEILGPTLPAPLARHYADGLTMYPASTPYLLGMLGLSMLSFALLNRWIDRRDTTTPPGHVVRFLQLWSTFSLTVYFVHLMAHIWPLWIYGVWMGQDDPTFYWQQAMSAPAALCWTLAFVVLGTLALQFLERHKKYSFEAFMRWLCD
ncbi:MAG TPA: heparan-alpha-glucosaminide N-acetyltransferase domain-containing protein [Gemmataceae bacterium]|nr:heparan-alpha-glucosaminide N-acetyltransferase domain-containing protein [Gemmataceae bacterium]